MQRIIWLFFCCRLRIATGCILDDMNSIEVTKYVGESVLLPCSCADLQAKPQSITCFWFKNRDKQIYPSSHPSDRIHMFNQDSPGNLSLFISDLTKEDEALYTCELHQSSYRYITLTVKASTSTPKAPPKTHTPVTEEKDLVENGGTATSPYIFILVAVLLLPLLLGGVIFLYMTHKGQKGEITKSGQMQVDEQQDDTRVYCTVQETRDDMFTQAENQDEVTYSTVIHSKKHRAAQVAMDTGDSTEYARIKRT